MAKTLRTSGDYTVKAGAGYDSGSGTNTIKLDARHVRIPGDLTIDGTQTVVNSQTLTVEDQFIETNRNNSTAGTEDSGIFFNQGSSNHALFYYDAGNGEFQLGTTTQDASASTISNITLGQLKVATTPSDANHAASKSYVDAQVSGGGYSLFFNGDDSTSITASAGTTVYFSGGDNITTSATEEPDQLNINLNRDLQGIDSISTDRSNQDLTLTANGTGEIIIDPVLTFTLGTANPTATSSTKVYNKTAGGGGTGLYFKNSNINSGTEGELISKAKATALAIALG
jgi:hypothetical protein